MPALRRVDGWFLASLSLADSRVASGESIQAVGELSAMPVN